jgi:Uma2 family endonuclease
MTERRILMTAGDFFRQYSHKDEYYELVKGEVVEMTPPGGVHGGIAVNIAIPLGSFVRSHDLGRVVVESGFHLERQPDTVRGPDVSFIRKERIPQGGLPRAFFAGAPDLAVEIVSPSDSAAGLEAKVRDYLRAGSLRVWAVYPDSKGVAVHRPGGSVLWHGEGKTIEDEELFPGFSLGLDEILDI